MQLISYDALRRLRLSDFLGDSSGAVYVEESGVRIVVGLGGYEEYGETRFGWRQGEAFQTAEVSLDLSASALLPKASASKILSTLGLPIRMGITMADLSAVFGNPHAIARGMDGFNLRFICGEEEKYVMGCHVNDRDGLGSMYFARKDFFDEGQAM